MDQITKGPAGAGCWKSLRRRIAGLAAFALAVAPGPFGSLHAADVVCPNLAASFLENGQWLLRMAHATPADPLRILAIGSSSTEGIGASTPTFAYPAQLRADLLRWGICAEVKNAGVGGERAAFTEMRLEAALKTYRPDLVIWQLGTNDAVTGEDEAVFRILLQKGISAVQEAKAGLLLLDPQFYPKINDLPRYERFVRIIADIAARDHVPVFSRYALMKAWAGQSVDELKSMLASDRFHMGDRGYVCLAQDLATEMAARWGRAPVIAASSANSAAKLAMPAKLQLAPLPAGDKGHT